MNVLAIIIGALVLSAVLDRRHAVLSASLGSAPGPINMPPPMPQSVMLPTGSIVEAQAGSMALGAISKGIGAIPVVGQAASQLFNQISGIFLAAHQQRLREATTENGKVAQFIPAFDRGIVQIVNAYNTGGISAGEAYALTDQLWRHYWQEVSPYIQPGRNGCQNGTAIDYAIGHPPTGTVAQHCGGDWGAACCLGAEVFGSSLGRLQQAIAETESSGAAIVTGISPVVASKYGMPDRAAYRVTVQRPA